MGRPSTRGGGLVDDLPPSGHGDLAERPYLYVAEESISNVTIFQINDSNTTPLTRLGSVTSGSVDGTSNTTSVAITPDGKYLYSANATNAEGAGIDTYSIGANGMLTQVNPEGDEFHCTAPSPNNNPLAYSGLLAISPNGQWLYEDGDGAVGPPYTNIGVCGMQIGAGGSLTDVGGGPFTDTTVSGDGTTFSNPNWGMAITPNNQNLYVANGNQGTVSTMSIALDGVVTQTATTPTGASPDGVAVSPDGHDVYVSNTGSGTISTYSIGGGGALTAVGTPVISGTSASSGPTWLAQTGTVEPQLTVKVSSTGLPPGGLSVGGTATIPVTVTASNGPVSAASLTLAVGGAGNVKLTGTPAGTTGFSLAVGQSATFNYTVTGVKPGTAVLNGTVHATATDGTAITGTGTGTFQVASRSLSVTITTDPRKVRLDANDDGNLQSKQILVNVKLTNTTKNTLSGVQLIGLESGAREPQPAARQARSPEGSLPKTYGTLAAGASLTKTFHLKVTGDGMYVINGLALYSDPTPSSGNARASGQGTFTVTAPLLYFTANKVGNPTVVSSGDSWYVSGHVKNLSSFQTLCLRPLAPDWIDNAGGLGPHQIGVVPVDQPAPALAGPVKPGETISFLMQVQTEVGGRGTSAVELMPEATLGQPGDDCNVLKMLTQPVLDADDVKLKPDTTKFRLPVAPVDTTPPDLNPFEFFGGYAAGSAAVFAHLYESGYSICKNFTLSGLLTSLRNGGIAAAGVLSKLFHAAAVSAWFWYLATDEQKHEFEQQVADAFVTKAGAVWDGTLDQIEAVTGTLMSKIQTAFMTGDWNSLFYALGDKSANVINEQAITVAEWEIAVGLISKTGAVARVIGRARELQSGVLTSLKAITPGRILNFAEMQRLWGLAYEDYLAFSRIAEEEGVLIGVRGRAPISVANLDEGAVWKHENLKPKNVSPIDTQWLGFPSADLGTVAFRTYTLKQREQIIESIYNSKLSIAQRDVVLKRAETRFGEVKYVKKIEHMAHEGVIGVGFNYADNGIARRPRQQHGRSRWRTTRAEHSRAAATRSNLAGPTTGPTRRTRRCRASPTRPGPAPGRQALHPRRRQRDQAAAVPGHRRHGRRVPDQPRRHGPALGQADQGVRPADGRRLAASGDTDLGPGRPVRLHRQDFDPQGPRARRRGDDGVRSRGHRPRYISEPARLDARRHRHERQQLLRRGPRRLRELRENSLKTPPRDLWPARSPFAAAAS